MALKIPLPSKSLESTFTEQNASFYCFFPVIRFFDLEIFWWDAWWAEFLFCLCFDIKQATQNVGRLEFCLLLPRAIFWAELSNFVLLVASDETRESLKSNWQFWMFPDFQKKPFGNSEIFTIVAQLENHNFALFPRCGKYFFNAKSCLWFRCPKSPCFIYVERSQKSTFGL